MRIKHNDRQLRKRQLYRPKSILVRSTALGAESLSPRASKWFVFILFYKRNNDFKVTKIPGESIIVLVTSYKVTKTPGEGIFVLITKLQ